ncbi:signal transduction histidine kinase [Kribbella aluminosa]|uniref:histidine kinase n=1 Tax=Kribbella aluminosa TaxID=416017 RepID=A0ABS4UHP1_9ACTN|nr:HAMP domain-containing sensor histidine kinase [Kribbella aluminosa]MBP2351162.1 signal transduction histidine kinase [Kribbella aluminosa]
MPDPRPRLGRRLRLSTAARAGLVAGLVAAVLAVGFGTWVHHQIYTSRYGAIERKADQDRALLISEMRTYETPTPQRSLTFQPVDAAYEITDDSGHLLESGPALLPFRPHALAPTSDQASGSMFVTVNTGLQGRCAASQPPPYCDTAKRMVGRRLWVSREALAQDWFKQGTKSTGGHVSVFVLPFEAEDAAAGVDRVLERTLPVAVLLIMIGAYFGTRAALRPVERMRARAAAISQRNLHDRLPVPATGDVVARLATTLNDTLARLEAAAQQQRGFVADAAHELRSPIAALRTTLEVAGEHPTRADWPQVNAAAVDEIRRLQQLADDLLLMARLDADDLTPHKAVDLAELVRRQLARRVDEGPGITFDSPESAVVSGDPRQLDRLVRNLIDNAIRYTHTAISVRIEDQPDQVVLHVDDDGAGIEPADRERVFERFTRLDEARARDDGGAGLGLAIAREIAHAHNSTLTATGSPHGGARFTLTTSSRSPAAR